MLGFLLLPLCGFSLHSASTMRAFAELGFCCAWPLPRRGRAEVVSARLDPSHGTINVRRVCNFLGFVSLQQKFEMMDRPVLQFRVTAQFYLTSKGKWVLKAWGRADPKDAKRRAAQFWLLFLYAFFLLSLSLPYVRASQEGCLFHLRFSLQSSDLPLFYFHGLFPSCLLATAILDSFFLF